VRGDVSFRVLFSADRTPTSSIHTGLTELAPGGWLGLHRHTQAQVCHLVEGSGVVVLDGAEHAVAAGSAVFIPGDAEHGVRNTGEGASASCTPSPPTRSTTSSTGSPPTGERRPARGAHDLSARAATLRR
jgi:quercetin dioxygenase-like cupin family protein